MAEAIIMPKTGMAMEEGTIIEWRVKVGDHIEKGDVVAEIETDKSTMELESDYAGFLLDIIYPEGTVVKVTKPIAWVGKPGELIPAASQSGETSGTEAAVAKPIAAAEPFPGITVSSSPGTVKATPAARRKAQDAGIDLRAVAPSGRHGEIRERDVESAGSVRSTPLARQIAVDRGMDLSTVPGSGMFGKVFSSDIPAGSDRPSDASEYTEVRLTTIQRLTGQRMMESKSTIPMVTEYMRADVTGLLALRQAINEDGDRHVSINDFVLMAAVKALLLYPRLNSTLHGDVLHQYSEVHLGMAVATERGLIVPVIRYANRQTFGELSAVASDLIRRGRQGTLKPDELTGSTCSVTNVGMYGVLSFNPIINPPEAAILGVCAVEDVPNMTDGRLAERKLMGLNLTFDHRIADGAQAAQFLAAVKRYLEKPIMMLV